MQYFMKLEEILLIISEGQQTRYIYISLFICLHLLSHRRKFQSAKRKFQWRTEIPRQARQRNTVQDHQRRRRWSVGFSVGKAGKCENR